MSENLPTNVQLESNGNGTVSFAPEVIATIAGVATMEVEGVASMYSANSGGLVEMFSRKSASSKTLTKGVRVEFNEGSVVVDLSVVVDYGMPIPQVSQGIQENVKKAVETMSGLTVSSVDVHVQGLSFERENQKALEEAQQQRIAMEKAVAEAEAELNREEPEQTEEEASDPEEPVEQEEEVCDCTDETADKTEEEK